MLLNEYVALFSAYLEQNNKVNNPKNLYEPIQYILNLGGKRIRPVLTLIACDGFGGTVENSLPTAMAVEIFHNFTLLHDDIMDEAPLRRGKPTVHKQWNHNTAILSGDAMMIEAFRQLDNYPPEIFKSLTQTLSQVALEVCEGQQYDMDFETQPKVALSEYIEMIRLKTAVLLGASLKMGAIIAKASLPSQQTIYDFGILTGLAFQLQDDYLDTFGDAQRFGKQIGGDIQENKKTWLYLKTLELADATDRDILQKYFDKTAVFPDKFNIISSLYQKYNIPDLIQNEIKLYAEKAQLLLDTVPMKTESKQALKTLLNQLEQRQH